MRSTTSERTLIASPSRAAIRRVRRSPPPPTMTGSGPTGRPERHRRAERPEPQPGPERRQVAERHPRLGDRLPGPADLRDLDEVVHQRQTREAGRVGRLRHAAQPLRRLLAPREPGHLEDDLHPQGRTAVGRRRGRGRGRRGHRVGSGRDSVDDVPALTRQGGLDVPDRPELAGEDRRRDRPVAGSVAAPALGLRGGQQHGHGRQPGGPTCGQPGQPASGIGAEGVDHRAQAASQPGGHDRLQEGERVRRGVQVVRAAADHAAQRVGGDDLLAAVAPLGPGGLARAGGADEDDERGVGEASGAQPNSSVSGSAEVCSSGRDHGVTGRGSSSPSTTRSVRSFQNARWSRTRAASSSGSG